MATTINAYSVSLSMEASAYIKGTQLARGETNRLWRAINDARTPQEKFALAQSRMNSALQKGAIDAGVYNRLMEKETQKLKDLTQQKDKATQSTSRLANAVKALGLAYIGLKIRGFIEDSLKLSIQVEQASARFEVLTGSVNNAQILMRQLRQEAAKSPITFVGMQDAAATLLQFNVRASQVMPTIQMLSAVAGGNEERFKSLALAYGQMQSAGRLMGQDLLQMINAGFNPLQEISRKTGESMIDLKKRMEDGAISSQEVAEAFLSATSEGGRFAGMADRLANTTGGRLAIAMSKLQEVMTKLGDILGPVVIELLDGFEKGEGAAYQMLKAVEFLSNGMRMLIALYKDAATSISAFASGDFSFKAFENVNKLLDEMERKRFEKMFPAATSDEIIDQTSDAASEATKAFEKAFTDSFDAIKNKASAMWESLKAAGEAFAKREQALRKEAMRIYTEQQRNIKQFQDSLASNIGQGGAEVGSSGAVAFQAKQANQGLISAIMKSPTDERMAATLEKIYTELKRNGFGRIR